MAYHFQLLEQDFYIDGMRFGDQCVLAAVRVDGEGRKHVLALRESAPENKEAAKDLLQHLVPRGVDPARKRLFVIDGSKALRAAINAGFGIEAWYSAAGITNCASCSDGSRASSKRGAASLMRTTWRMKKKDGVVKFRQIAAWLER